MHFSCSLMVKRTSDKCNIVVRFYSRKFFINILYKIGYNSIGRVLVCEARSYEFKSHYPPKNN